MRMVPTIRVRGCNEWPVCPDKRFVLYWMNAFRRVDWNFSLQRAVEHSNEMQKPLLVLETLRCNYPWASDRIHQFLLEGHQDRATRVREAGAKYALFVEQKPGSILKLLRAVAKQSCLVVADDFPDRSVWAVVSEVAQQIKVSLEVVDSNGLLPLRSTDRVFPSAYAFRRFLQHELPQYLSESPSERPLAELQNSWKAQPETGGLNFLAEFLLDEIPPLKTLPINHDVEPVKIEGGSHAAVERWREFLNHHLSDYAELRNYPEQEATSGLSPYLQSGNISVHQIFYELMRTEGWSPARLSPTRRGQRQGWWGVSESAEGFLDELITWRELGYNMAWQWSNYDQFESLPEWARQTLLVHSEDPRTHVYCLEEFEEASTHDPLWNAAQRQLRTEGSIHNYLRMLWGKKILEWSASPQEALACMIELNNKYALDGRNPNSYAGIFWVLGRYDRAWGPERPIFGKIRYMSSENTARKLPVKGYLEKYAKDSG